jgi:hypothetical protein
MKSDTHRYALSRQPLIQAVCCGILAVQLCADVGAQPATTLAEENAQLQAGFDLMVRQLGARDDEIRELKQRIAELEKETGATTTQALGCPVDTARQVVVAESFLYDRENALLGWLAEHVHTCKLLELQDLDTLARRSSLNQSRSAIRDELARRGESPLEEASVSAPLTRP